MKAHTIASACAFAQATPVDALQHTSGIMQVAAHTAPVASPGGHGVKILKRAAAYTTAALTAGLLLSGCATAGPNTPDGCVGPPDFCQPYFGN